jgi:hypothetical protein
MTQHTPGPWDVKTVLDEVDQLERQVIAVPIPHSARKHIAQICTWGGNPDLEAQANARLIAAAPELLEALKNLVKWDGTKSTDPRNEVRLWGEIVSDANAAIAKAETDQPAVRGSIPRQSFYL